MIEQGSAPAGEVSPKSALGAGGAGHGRVEVWGHRLGVCSSCFLGFRV